MTHQITQVSALRSSRINAITRPAAKPINNGPVATSSTSRRPFENVAGGSRHP